MNTVSFLKYLLYTPDNLSITTFGEKIKMWFLKSKKMKQLEDDYVFAIESLKRVCKQIALLHNPSLKDIPLVHKEEQHHLPIVNEEILYEKLIITKNDN